jgi:hypothetical protein
MVWCKVLRDRLGTVSIVVFPVPKRMICGFINWEDFSVVTSRVGSDTETHYIGSEPSEVRLHA